MKRRILISQNDKLGHGSLWLCLAPFTLLSVLIPPPHFELPDSLHFTRSLAGQTGLESVWYGESQTASFAPPLWGITQCLSLLCIFLFLLVSALSPISMNSRRLFTSRTLSSIRESERVRRMERVFSISPLSRSSHAVHMWSVDWSAASFVSVSAFCSFLLSLELSSDTLHNPVSNRVQKPRVLCVYLGMQSSYSCITAFSINLIWNNTDYRYPTPSPSQLYNNYADLCVFCISFA